MPTLGVAPESPFLANCTRSHISSKYPVFPSRCGLAKFLWWSRRQESDLYLTLRRHVHYPLCYGETVVTWRTSTQDYSRQIENGDIEASGIGTMLTSSRI